MQYLKNALFSSVLAAALAIPFTTGCESERSDGRSSGRMVDDKKITENVEKQLKSEPVYKFENVEVRTFNGVVQLSGFALTEEQKRRAAELAQQVPGVSQVVNNITITPQTSPTGRPAITEPPQDNPPPPAAPPGNP